MDLRLYILQKGKSRPKFNMLDVKHSVDLGKSVSLLFSVSVPWFNCQYVL